METHKYGQASTGRARMKTTVEISDDLYRRAKATAALQGRRLKDLVEEGLQLVLGQSGKIRSQEELQAQLKRASGIVASGVTDLASNPEHLAGFGRDGRRNR
jgi:hypothetical protein